jgi:hypothetical protein
MDNAQGFLNELKKVARNTVLSMPSTDALFGEVTQVDPLIIKVDNKFYIDEEFLVLTSNVSDYTVNINVNLSTENSSGGSGEGSFDAHAHQITGEKEVTIKNALTVSDKVILLRMKTGQEFIVLDRVR